MGESDVDGDFVTTLEHGLEISLNKLFDRYYPTLTHPNDKGRNPVPGSMVFEGVHKTYRIEHFGPTGTQEASFRASIATKPPQSAPPETSRLETDQFPSKIG